VHDEQTFPPGGLVNPLAVNLKLALEHLGHDTKTRVMVAGDVDQPGTRALTGQQRTYDLGVFGTPEEAARHAERVNNVTYENDAFGVDTLEKFIELASASAFETEMDIRQEQRPYLRPSSTLGVAVGHVRSLLWLKVN
jgi:hypothetical protein